MDLMTLIQLLHAVPYVGPVIIYVPLVVVVGAAVATVLPAPSDNANAAYKLLYAIVSWCALNKGEAVPLTAPTNKGLVAGPAALTNPQIAASVVPAATPLASPTAVPVIVVGDQPPAKP